MAGHAPSQPSFAEILERGAQVDDIFKDQPMPRGSDPFELNPEAGANAESGEVEIAQVSIADNDSLFCVNRKFAAVEALFKLVTREQITFGQLISEILRIAMEQVKSEAGSFLEIDYTNSCLFFRAAAGRESEGLMNFTVPLGQGIAGFVCETQQPMALSSIDDSSVYLRSISNAVGFEAKNMVAYPVVIRGVTFGCLELLNRLGEPQYTDADKEVVATICNYAAKLIENRLVMASMSKELATYKQSKQGDAA